jgi:hypothetical protein
MPASLIGRLGFRRDWVYEIIVTSNAPGGRPHSAPMGVLSRDLRTLTIIAYKKTRTCRNLLSNGFFTVSLPDSVLEFQKALMDNKQRYVKTKTGYRLTGLGYMKLKVTAMKDAGDVVEFTASVLNGRVQEGQRLFNRAEMLALEYLIRKTKPHAGRNELSEIRRVVNKVAPKSIYAGIVK